MFTHRLCLLGPADFSRDRQPVRVTAAKAIALLGYLAVTDTAQHRDAVGDLLWPDSLADAARKNLRNTLWTIRRDLGDLVVTEGDLLSLADSVWTDLRVFAAAVPVPSSTAPAQPMAQLQAAVALYRGPLLEGLSLADAPEYELWLAAQREMVERGYQRTVEALAAAHRAAQQWQPLIAVAERALTHDPLQEPMARLLMEAYARTGQRSRALHQYERLQEALARELDVAPLAETVAVAEAVRSGLLSPLAAPTPVGPAPRSAQKRSYSPVAQPYVGRQAEHALLDAEFALAARGQVRIVLISGELGIGKSRLWQEWSAALPVESPLLETRCLESGRSLPYAPLISLFSRPACVSRLLRQPSPIPPVWLAELGRLIPEIGTELAPPLSLPPEEERRRLFESFTQVLRAVDGRPLVLCLDDLHWADGATLDWLDYLVHRMQDAPLLLAATYRPPEASPQLARLAAGWRREGFCRILPLQRLTTAEGTALVEALTGDAERASQLYAQSAGNPYFLIELARATGESTPPELAALVRARLQRLPDMAGQVLQAAAVLGDGCDFAVLQRVSGRSEEELLDAQDALLEGEVLVERSAGYEFVHPLVATVVLDDLSAARRRFLHRRAAVILAAARPGRLEAIAGQLAFHYAQAEMAAETVHYATLAARRALQLAAPAESAAFYRQALALQPDARLQVELAEALLIQGDPAGGRLLLQEALAALEARGDAAGIVGAYLVLAESYMPAGRRDQTAYWAQKALLRLDDATPVELRARAHFLLGTGLLHADDALADGENHLHTAARLAAENNLLAIAGRSQFELGNLLAERGELQAALAAFELAIARSQAAGERMQELLGYNNLAYHALLAGDLARAHAALQVALDEADASAFLMPCQYLYSTRGELALAEGDLDAAHSWFERALAQAQQYENQLQAANIQANLGLVQQARGELAEALRLLSEAQQAVASLPAPHLHSRIDLWLAALLLERGEPDAARAVLAQSAQRLADSPRAGLRAELAALQRRLAAVAAQEER